LISLRTRLDRARHLAGRFATSSAFAKASADWSAFAKASADWSAFAKASADWLSKPVEAFGIDGCCGPCMGVISSVFGTASGAAPVTPRFELDRSGT
jgi:hypothetical protein